MALIRGWIFDDTLGIPGSSADDIFGDRGNDVIRGWGGNDHLYGDDGHDQLFGGTGQDALYGGNGNDALEGNEHNDNLYGGFGSDILFGGSGSDYLSGGDGADQLFGGTEDDTLEGGYGNDLLFGEGNNDRFHDYAGSDVFNGGSGIDTVDYSGYYGKVTVTLGDGSVAGTGLQSARLYSVSGGVSYTPDGQTDTIVSVENITGTSYDDKLTGNSVANVINGGNGDDVITGGGGWDILFGGEGRDTFVYRSTGDATNDSDLTNGRQAELIMDFKLMEDHIDVSAIDANANLRGDQAFVFVATFTGAAGELQARLYNEDSTDPYWMVWGETNGIAGTDLWIETHIDPTSQPANLGAIASDFIL